jgi:hypothetical protein
LNENEKSEPVGPQRYHPYNPTHVDHGVKIGKAKREEVKGSNFLAPAPTTYEITGDFEKAKVKP